MGRLDHEHTHDHTHSHYHDHLHSHEPLQAKDGAVDEQTVAVLRDMLDHNIHHASELSDLADQPTGEARPPMLPAVGAFHQAHGHPSAGLALLEEQEQG